MRRKKPTEIKMLYRNLAFCYFLGWAFKGQRATTGTTTTTTTNIIMMFMMVVRSTTTGTFQGFHRVGPMNLIWKTNLASILALIAMIFIRFLMKK